MRVPAATVPGARYYAYRIAGPFAPHEGHRFDAQKILLDPYATGVFFPPAFSRTAAAPARRKRRPGAAGRAAGASRLPRRAAAARPALRP